MKVIKHLGILTIGLFTSCTFFSCSPNLKEQETTKPETSYVLQYQENKKIEEQKAWDVLSREGASIVKNYKERHDESVEQTGVGIFYGSASSYSEGINKHKLKPHEALVYEGLAKEIRRADCQDIFGEEKEAARQAREEAKSAAQVINPPARTDCLEWCMLNFRDAAGKSGMKEEWVRIESRTLELSRKAPTSVERGTRGIIGSELAKALVENGWIGLYYNPDTRLPSDKPAVIPPSPESAIEKGSWKMCYYAWTEHTASYETARKHKHYNGVPVSDFIINYSPTTELEDIRHWSRKGSEDSYTLGCHVPVASPTVKQSEKAEQLKKVPFGFLLARGGTHVALISYGKVYEVHYAYEPWCKDLIEVKDFETEWQWLSGAIVVPPGSWKIK